MIPAIAGLAAVALVVLVAVVVAGRKARDRRRKELMGAPFPQDWRKYIEKNVPLYSRMPDDLKEQLCGLVNVFVAEKTFHGCRGLEITDEIRVTIAAQACMLLLNRKTHFFRKLRTIYVYPHTYVANQTSYDGVMVIEGKSVRLGESWQNGPVVLAWDSVMGGARNIHDGRNVVMHEFSHQLDQEDGTADGAPILQSRSSCITWARVLSAEYEALCRKAGSGRRSAINKYGATNPAEFFAVITEAFFEKPEQMKRKHAGLYDELKSYYKVDPAEWVRSGSRRLKR